MTFSLRIFVILLAVASLACGAKPNFVIILSDDMGYSDIRRPATLQPWELYNMSKDRVESNNLAEQKPDLVQKLERKWEDWANRARVKPWPWKFESD